MRPLISRRLVVAWRRFCVRCRDACWWLGLGLGLGACAGLQFGQARVDLEPTPSAVAALQPGRDNLASCLAALGAPSYVQRDRSATDFVLTWEWVHSYDWGLFFSVPLSDAVNGSINYGDFKVVPRRLQLIFNPDWILLQVLEE